MKTVRRGTLWNDNELQLYREVNDLLLIQVVCMHICVRTEGAAVKARVSSRVDRR